MGKREKLTDRLTTSPQTATFGDIRQLLKLEGFDVDPSPENYDIFTYAETIFVIPVHNDRVKVPYLQKILELVESADLDWEEED